MRSGHGRADGRPGRVHAVRSELLAERDGRDRVQGLSGRLLLCFGLGGAAAVPRRHDQEGGRDDDKCERLRDLR
eukprot:1184738-Prymnesium_polylepis.1